RELPAEELTADRIRVRQMNLGALAVRAVEALAGRRNEALALLARRLGDELLGPQPEVPVGRLDAHLVTALPPAFAELEAELQPGVRVAPARLGHPLGVREQTLGFDAHKSSGNDPEARQRRVPAADRRLAVEHAHPPLPRELFELRAGIGDHDELLRIAG